MGDRVSGITRFYCFKIETIIHLELNLYDKTFRTYNATSIIGTVTVRKVYNTNDPVGRRIHVHKGNYNYYYIFPLIRNFFIWLNLVVAVPSVYATLTTLFQLYDDGLL